MQYCLVEHQQCEDIPPLVVTRSLVIDQADKTWQIHIHNHKLEPSLIPSLTGIPAKLTPSSASLLLHQLSQLKTCVGNPDFISLGKEKKNLLFLSSEKSVVAFLDRNACVYAYDQCYPVTVRCSTCHLLSEDIRCSVCSQHRSNLRAQLSRFRKTEQPLSTKNSKHINYR